MEPVESDQGNRYFSSEIGFTVNGSYIYCFIFSVYSDRSLPETSSLPCGKYFAVCQNSGTRQTSPLPCANRKDTRQLTGTRQTFSLPCVRTKNTRQSPNARQRCSFAVCCQIKHTAKAQHTAKKPCLPCAQAITHGNHLAHGEIIKKKQILHSQFFVLYIYSVLYSVLKFGIFLVTFDIFSHLIYLIEILGLNWKCFEQWSIMDRKMIFMLWSAM